MAYIEQPVAPKPRPGAVTAAVYLLYVMGALMVVSAAIGLLLLPTMREAMNEAYAELDDAQRDVAVQAASVGIVAAAVITLLIGVGFMVLGLLNGKGKNAARIVTWVVAGISLCCGIVGLAGSFARGFGGSANGQGPDPADVERIMNEHLPAWYQPVNVSLQLITILATVLIIILLALPAANEFFRKPAVQVWEPTGMTPPPVPGQPQQPPAAEWQQPPAPPA